MRRLESGACLRGFGYLKGFFSGLYRYASSRFYQLVVYPCDFRAGIRPCLFPLLERKGRKAIAVSFGVLLGLLPWYHVVFALATLYIFLSIGVVINPHRLRSIATYTLFAIYCVYAYWLQGRLETSIFCGCLLVCLIVVGKHLRPEEKEKFQIEILPALFDPKKSGTADR